MSEQGTKVTQDLWQFTIEADKDHAFDMVDHLEIMCFSISIFESQKDQKRQVIEGTCTKEPLEHTIMHIIQDSAERVIPSRRATLQIMKLPDKDWLAENRQSFPPVEIGDFYIHGSHENPSDDLEKINILVDASTAFGTGNHETTRGCIKALARLRKEGRAIQSPIDVGTGTGILAIAIAKLFQIPVIATDSDPDALEKALFNAQENHVNPLITGIKAEGLNHPELQLKAPYDLIVANILAGPLMDMSESLLNALSKDGTLILSGILGHQKQALLGFYTAPDLEVIHENHDGEWVTLTLRRQPIKSPPIDKPYRIKGAL